MSDDDKYDIEYYPNGGVKSRKLKGSTDAAKTAVAEKMKTTNLGTLGKAVDKDAPKQEEGESPAAFAKRFREYREARAKK